MNKHYEVGKSYIIMLIGIILYCLSWTLFLIPAEITGGGVSGIGALVFYSTGIPAGITFFGVNLILVAIAIWKLGASFGNKTIINMVLISILLTVLQSIKIEPLINDTFLSAVLGGILGGVGVGIVFSQGGSTGGTDIIAMIVNKYRRMSPGRVILYCDVLIISTSWFIFKSPEKLVYGYVTMWVVSYTIDAFLNGENQSAQMFIFSEKWEEIRDHILHVNNRGVTIFDGTGGFTNKPVKMIMVVMRKRETTSVFKLLKTIDPDAFISMGNVMGVYGQGFEQIRG